MNERTVGSILEEIAGDKHKEYTSFLRAFYNSGDKENYTLNKKKLPAATFCGLFDKDRTKESLSKYNSLIVLDIDKLGVEEMIRIKDVLLNDKYVFTFWESPSKDGIKGLIYLQYSFPVEETGLDIAHKGAFLQLSHYFKEKHNIILDNSGNDFTRLCFISCDEQLILKMEVFGFPIEKNEKMQVKGKQIVSPRSVLIKNKDQLYNPAGKNNPNHKSTMIDIIRYLEKNSVSITHAYSEWIRVAFAISNSFTYDVGEKYFLKLSQLDKDKFDEDGCKNILRDCYYNSKGEIKFNSIIHYAVEKGFKYKEKAEST